MGESEWSVEAKISSVVMKSTLKPRLGLHEDLAKRVVFIDGITRCGKSMFTGIIPSLEGMEHVQFYNILEHVIPAMSLGWLEDEFTRVFLRMNLNELCYNIQLSRGVNFRPDDQSGIPNYRNPQVYHDRLKRMEGEEIVTELREGRQMTPFQTHDILVNLEHLDKLNIQYQMLELFRHPIDNAYSWWARGWGSRFGTDPRAFTLTLERDDRQLPWYCLGYEEKWLAMNPAERSVYTSVDLIKRSVEQYLKAPNKSLIHILTFEDFCTQPAQELKRICDFLGTKTTSETPQYIAAARCPRILNSDDRLRKLTELNSKCSKEIIAELLRMSKSYETNLYGLQ